MQKPIVVHVHLFKNAGTSVEACLRAYFGERWLSYDKPSSLQRISQAELLELLSQNPNIQAISSHQIRPPLHSTPEFKLLPLVFLRDPLDRLRSAYDFESRQGAVSRSSTVASTSTFSEWLDSPIAGGLQVDNFQTYNLSSIRSPEGALIKQIPTSEHFADTLGFLNRIPAIGLVEHFDATWMLIEAWLRQYFPDFETRVFRANTTTLETSYEKRVDAMKDALGETRFNEVTYINRYDRLLYDTVARAMLPDLRKNTMPHQGEI